MKPSGVQLRELRELYGWTLREVANHTGVSNPYICQLETGRASWPHPRVLRRLAKAYGRGAYAKMMLWYGYWP